MLRHLHIPRPAAALAVAVAASLSVAACGGSGQTAHPDASASAPSSGVRFAACVRAHGVPDFPDPGSGSSSAGSAITAATGKVTVDGHVLSESHPRVEAAISHCGRTTSAAVGVPVHVTAAQEARIRTAALAYSVCMRAHGLPSFGDMGVSFDKGPAHDNYELIAGRGDNAELGTAAYLKASGVCSPALTRSFPANFGK